MEEEQTVSFADAGTEEAQGSGALAAESSPASSPTETEGQVETLAAAKERLETEISSHRDALQASNERVAALEKELADQRVALEAANHGHLETIRRALLAENAGAVVPELVAGATVEEMEASLEAAKAAWKAAVAAAQAQLAASSPIPPGNPLRQGPDLETMSPLQKIAQALARR